MPQVLTTQFFRKVEDLLLESNNDYNILCGDFNLVLDPLKDSHNYKHINNPKSKHVVLEMINNAK